MASTTGPQRGPDSGQRTAGPVLSAQPGKHAPLGCYSLGRVSRVLLSELRPPAAGNRRLQKSHTPQGRTSRLWPLAPRLQGRTKPRYRPQRSSSGGEGTAVASAWGDVCLWGEIFLLSLWRGAASSPCLPKTTGVLGAPEHPSWTLELLPEASARCAGRCAEQMPWGQPSFPWAALEPSRACRRETGRARPTGRKAGWLGGSLPGKERVETWPPGRSLCSHQGVLIDRGSRGNGRPPLLRSQTQPDPVGA